MDASRLSKQRLIKDEAISFRNYEITRTTILRIRKIYGHYTNSEVQASIKGLGKDNLNYERCKALQIFIKDYCVTSEKQEILTHEVLITASDILKKNSLRRKKLKLLTSQKETSITILSISKKANEAIAQCVIDFEIPNAHMSIRNYRRVQILPAKQETCCVLY